MGTNILAPLAAIVVLFAVIFSTGQIVSNNQPSSTLKLEASNQESLITENSSQFEQVSDNDGDEVRIVDQDLIVENGVIRVQDDRGELVLQGAALSGLPEPQPFPDLCQSGYGVIYYSQTTLQWMKCENNGTYVPIGEDFDWARNGTSLFPFNWQNDIVGIGTNTPQALFHVDETITTTGTETALITFTNGSPPLNGIGAFGLRVQASPFTGKGTQIGIETLTSANPAGGFHQNDGSTLSRLSQSSGWNQNGQFISVHGQSTVDAIRNAQGFTSFGVGGRFISGPQPGSTLALNNIGTYWIGGSFSELRGAINSNQNAGAVAAVIGVDNSTGTANSHAGYFQGSVQITNIPQVTSTPQNVLVPGTGGVISQVPASQLFGTDNDWTLGTGVTFLTNSSHNVGIGTSLPDRPITIKGKGANSEWISFRPSLSNATQWHLNAKNGGFNFVETGVADFRMFIQAGGNVGIGTGNPTTRAEILHSDPATGANVLRLTNEGNGSNFTETGIAFNAGLPTNPNHFGARIYHKYDGSGTFQGRLSLQVRDGGGSLADLLNLIGDRVGINTTAPTEALDVNGQARVRVLPTGQPNMLNVVADSQGVLHTVSGSSGGISSSTTVDAIISPADQSTQTGVATCPVGTVRTGGGFFMTGTIGVGTNLDQFAVLSNMPAGSSGWTVQVRRSGPVSNGRAWGLRVFVVCVS